MRLGDVPSPAFAGAIEEERVRLPDLCLKRQTRPPSSSVLALIIMTINAFSLFVSESALGQIRLQESVKIGGIQQWIQINGTRDKNPILLFLHGGPGNSVMSYARKFTAELQKHFVVVQWDQRGSGKTLQLNPPNQPLSLAVVESDVLEMTNYLRARFSRQKIYLMGHSWGGFLALQAAAHHPELFVACLAVSPMVNQLESENLSLAWMKEKARENKNTLATEELQKIKIPFQDGEQIYYHRNWLAVFTGNKSLSKTYVLSWAAKWLSVFNEASAVNFTLTAPEIRCPVFFFVGTHDYQTHFKLTEDYFKMLKAEKKELFWFTNSGHNLNLTEPKKLQEIIIQLHKNNLTEYP
jgi:pimeloyl-ACP methyl ester carboxylesterase